MAITVVAVVPAPMVVFGLLEISAW